MGKHWIRLSMVCLVVLVIMISPVSAQVMNSGIVVVAVPAAENSVSSLTATPTVTIAASAGQCVVVRVTDSTTAIGNATAKRTPRPNSLW